MKRVAVMVANDRDACVWYRAMSPWSRLAELGLVDVRYYVAAAPNYAEMRQCDLFFVSRPSTAAQVGVIEMAHRFDKPIWIDWDDNIFEVPRDNPMRQHYSSAESHKTIEHALSLANVVTCTTDNLANVLREKTSGVVEVVKNAIDPVLMKMRQIVPAKRDGLLVMWRGSATHERDLREHSDAIIACSMRYPDATFMFVGYDPWWLTEKIERSAFVPSILPLWHYMGVVRTIGPDVMIVPLADNLFNRSKSEIAAVEGTLAGALAVSPDRWGISKGPFGYASTDGFSHALDAAMWVSKEFRRREAEKQFDHVVTNFSLDDKNDQRLAILDRACA